MVGGTLTQLGKNGEEHVVYYFSRRFSLAEEIYSTTVRKLLGIVYFLQRFCCYLEKSTFEAPTDNQVLRYFFIKPSLSRREARWLEFLGHFGATNLTLVKWKVHVLEDAPSRAPQTQGHALSFNNLWSIVLRVAHPEGLESNYYEDPTFGDVYQVLKGEQLAEKTKQDRVSRMLNDLELKGTVLYPDPRSVFPL